MAPKKQSNAPRTNDEALTPVATYSARGNQTIVRKSNDLIQNAMYSLTLSQQKLMLHIFAMIKPSDTELPRYEMSIYEFLKLCGVDPHNGSMYKQVKKNIEDIANAKVQWIRLAGTQKITMFRWLSSATIDEGTGKIVLTLDQSLKPHLIQLKEFYTTMNITYTLPMKQELPEPLPRKEEKRRTAGVEHRDAEKAGGLQRVQLGPCAPHRAGQSQK